VTLDREQAKQVVKRFEGVRVAILGDVMLDHYVWGRVNRISPEAPVPIVEVTRESEALGGAGNVAMNVSALGGYPQVLGVVGDDEAGRRIVELLRKAAPHGVHHVLLDRTRPSTLKRRVVAHNQHVVRVDRESRAPVDEALRTEMLERLQGEMAHLGALIVSDYNKGVLSRDFFDRVAALCRASNVPCFLDPKAFDLQGIGPVTAITPNEREAEAISSMKISDNATAEKAGAAILARTGAQHIVVTRGEHGMALFSSNRPPFHLPTQARQVFDVTGAGDTVVAVLAMAVAAGASMTEAAQLANLAAGIVVGRVGTATVSCMELDQALEGNWPDPDDAPHPYRQGFARQVSKESVTNR
jgi:rfaE bifunctional protein kinase chain/domain